ncbi:diacylglycerol/lipid kinase family protein [Staphylococcus ratti]|uniref:Diacylglycerol kinase family lipid kinase n=1 Tax=Staphylococcus ratti TaxID=2892440 RepID=A0ABY3PBR8_9STAP|nr:diacylglycerol kinase family protein [Staphylococcus ratti]UEX89766.1 diacylglycerol kinase family lipid kinase [Staphylococcus ratti]
MTHKYKNGLLFYHQHSGLNKIHEGLGDVTVALTQLCKKFSIQLSEEEGDIARYCQRIAQTDNADGLDVLFILGGDGTVNELINGIIKNQLDLPVGVIPGGTFNDFAKTLNLSNNASHAAYDLLSSEPKAYDVMKVNDQYALNFAGIGLMVQNAENVEGKSKDVFGKLSYISSTLKTLANPEHFNYELNIDGKTYTGDTSMILFANGRFIGGGKVPMTDLSPTDGELNTFIFNNYSISILKDIFSLRDSMTWNEISENIKHIPSYNIHLSTTPHMRVDIDGEINLKTPISIEICAQKIKLLTVPPNIPTR